MAAIVALTGCVGWATAGDAQTVTGQARAVQATVLGSQTVLSDTGRSRVATTPGRRPR